MSHPHTFPILETERLILRPHELKDFKHSVDIWQSPVTLRYIHYNHPVSEEEIWTRFLRYIGHWHMLGFGYWVIEEKKSGCFIGEAGFADYKREMNPRILNLPEIGWLIAPHAQGQGYASETISALLAWGEHYFPKRTKSVCYIHPENSASIHLAEKHGFKVCKQTHYQGRPVILFKRSFRSS